MKFGHTGTGGRVPATGVLIVKSEVSKDDRRKAMDQIARLEATVRTFPALKWYNARACKHQIKLLQSIWHWVDSTVWEPMHDTPDELYECPHWSCRNCTPFDDIFCQHCCVRVTDVDALTLLE